MCVRGGGGGGGGGMCVCVCVGEGCLAYAWSLSPCQTPMDYGNTQTAKHALKSMDLQFLSYY